MFVIQDLKEMFFIWCMFLFFILMMLMGNTNDKEEEENIHKDSFSEDGKGLEGVKGNEGEREGEDTSKQGSPTQWNYVKKLEVGKRGGTKNLCATSLL